MQITPPFSSISCYLVHIANIKMDINTHTNLGEIIIDFHATCFTFIKNNATIM